MNASFLKRMGAILLMDGVETFEARVGAVTSAAILGGVIDVEYCLCRRQCLYSQKTRIPSPQTWSSYVMLVKLHRRVSDSPGI